jgi:membrane protease YdiL (CAAX protease family)
VRWLKSSKMFSISEFIQYLHNPRYPSFERKSAHIPSITFKIYLLLILFTGLIGVLCTILIPSSFKLPVDTTLEIPYRFKDNLWGFFLVVAFIGPLLEEILFRLSLVFEPSNIALSGSTLLYLVFRIISNRFISLISFFLLLIILFRIAYMYKSEITSFWNKNFKYIFYLLSLSFGLFHMSNYRYSEVTQFLIAPILVLPQIVMGLVLSFTRVYYKRGFLMGVFTHILINFITISIIMLHS